MSYLTTEALKERYEKDKKYMTVYTDFRPNLKVQTLTPKFYSIEAGKMVDKFNEKFVKMVADYKTKGPRDKLSYPETVNQSYGWHLTPLIDADVNDRRLQHHHKSPSDIRTALYIKHTLSKFK